MSACSRGLALAAALGVALAGCAVLSAGQPERAAESEALAASHRKRAEDLDRRGSLHAALDEWKVVLTLTPDNPDARARRRRLEARIAREVSDRMRRGREALARGRSSVPAATSWPSLPWIPPTSPLSTRCAAR